MFSPKQTAALKAPLNREHVKDRSQAGRKLSYLEAWHCIDEANRIFGFDAWSRETVECRLVSEQPRKDKPGFRVSYVARVRIRVVSLGETIDDAAIIVREGTGAGHGIDADLGLAHESAIKEAESDAMKRALMTFGNPFGLALYDKEQANVVDGDADDEHDESRERYIEECRHYIVTGGAAYPDLVQWWKDEAKNRRDFCLSQNEVNELKALVTAKAPREAA